MHFLAVSFIFSTLPAVFERDFPSPLLSITETGCPGEPAAPQRPAPYPGAVCVTGCQPAEGRSTFLIRVCQSSGPSLSGGAWPGHSCARQCRLSDPRLHGQCGVVYAALPLLVCPGLVVTGTVEAGWRTPIAGPCGDYEDTSGLPQNEPCRD